MQISVYLRFRLLSGLSVALIVIYISTTYADRVSDKIYSALQSDHYCSRRLNATHQMGCTSDLGGNLGIVWIAQTESDIEHILKTGPTPPYIAVLDRNFYTRKILLEFKANLDRVAGVVFLDKEHDNSKQRPVSFSPDDVCPNRHSGLYHNDSYYGDCKRNTWQIESPVSGLLYDDIPYPIFLINDKKSADEIKSCFNDHNVEHLERNSDSQKKKQNSYPLCGMQLDSFMMAAGNSEVCLNSRSAVDEILQSFDRRCNTVDNQNIFAYLKTARGPLHPMNGTKLLVPDVVPSRSIIMLVAKLSSLSMFTEISPGADSAITSIVTLLAIAEALAKEKDTSAAAASDRNIAFALIDSESFDYTGSTKLVYSMSRNLVPNSYFTGIDSSTVPDAMQNINLTSIDTIINLDQIANYLNSDSIHFHSNPNEVDNSKLESIYRIMSDIASMEKVKLVREDSKLPLPPTSVHEFIKASQRHKEDGLTALVLSNYGEKYTNLFYNSIYDDSHNVYQTSKEKLVEHITRVAQVVAKSLYEMTFNVKSSDAIKVDKQTVEDLLHCYMIDANCNLFTRAWQAGQRLPNGPVQTYKDPAKRSDDMNGAITAHLLAYFIGDKMQQYNLTQCYKENAASLIYNFQYINGKDTPAEDKSAGVCVRSQVSQLSEHNPAFLYINDEFQVDSRYPAWTVSMNGIRNPVRLYLQPSPISQWCIFILGIVVTLASIIIVNHIRSSFAKINSTTGTQTATPT